jgi:hypothetical protein
MRTFQLSESFLNTTDRADSKSWSPVLQFRLCTTFNYFVRSSATLDKDFPERRDLVPRMAEDAETDYDETVEIHGRDFQRYSIENKIYGIPVDIVSPS